MFEKQLEIIKNKDFTQEPVFSSLYENYKSYEKSYFDTNGNLVQQEEFDFTNNLISKIVKEYDCDNKLVKDIITGYENKQVQYTNTHKYFYDDKNNLVKETLNIISKITSAIDPTTIEYIYDERNNCVKKISKDENGEIIYLEEYEYDKNNNCIKEIDKYNENETVSSIEYKYENNKLINEIYKDSDGEVQDIYKYEYFNENERKVTQLTEIEDDYGNKTNQFEILESITEITDNNGNLIKRIIQDDETCTTYLYKSEFPSPIEEFYEEKDGYKSHLVRKLNDNNILDTIEVSGNKELVLTEKNLHILQKPIILKYDCYKSHVINCIIEILLELIIVPPTIFIGIINFKTDIIYSLIGLILIGVPILVILLIKPFKNILIPRNQFFKYEIDTAKQTITVYNLTETSIEKAPLYYVPTKIVHFNAIREAEIVVNRKKLSLSLHDNTSWDIFYDRKVLNLLNKFIQINKL